MALLVAPALNKRCTNNNYSLLHNLLFVFQLISAITTVVNCANNEKVRCIDRFVGEVKDAPDAEFVSKNETYQALCLSPWCIKVFIYDGFSDAPHNYQRMKGVRSRCAYTGGDRQICERSGAESCTRIYAYEGLRGNFSMCCCEQDDCNQIHKSEVNTILKWTGKETVQPKFGSPEKAEESQRRTSSSSAPIVDAANQIKQPPLIMLIVILLSLMLTAISC